MLAGIPAAIVSKSYLTIPWRIRECISHPPDPRVTMITCGDVSTQFYYNGSLYLGIEKPLVESLAAADVVIVGNSRTQQSLSNRAVEDYFARKGLRYFILASEGSGFRLTQLTLERLGIKPRVILMNNESFFIDIVEDANRDLVLDPDRFKAAASAFYLSKRLQQRVCASDFAGLRALYCEGKTDGYWRRIDNGALYSRPPLVKKLVALVPVPETRMNFFNRFMDNARQFLGSPSVKDACVIDYVVPSLNSSVDLARTMAREIHAPFVFPPVAGYESYDGGSHLTPESSERWAAEFLREADPEIDRCLARTAARQKFQ